MAEPAPKLPAEILCEIFMNIADAMNKNVKLMQEAAKNGTFSEASLALLSSSCSSAVADPDREAKPADVASKAKVATDPVPETESGTNAASTANSETVVPPGAKLETNDASAESPEMDAAPTANSETDLDPEDTSRTNATPAAKPETDAAPAARPETNAAPGAKRETKPAKSKQSTSKFSGYLLYSKEARAQVKEQQPDLPFADISRQACRMQFTGTTGSRRQEVGKQWQELPDAGKKVWNDKAAEQKAQQLSDSMQDIAEPPSVDVVKATPNGVAPAADTYAAETHAAEAHVADTALSETRSMPAVDIDSEVIDVPELDEVQAQPAAPAAAELPTETAAGPPTETLTGTPATTSTATTPATTAAATTATTTATTAAATPSLKTKEERAAKKRRKEEKRKIKEEKRRRKEEKQDAAEK